MAVGNAENFQHALQRAVLAGPAVQHIERDVGLGGGQRRGDVTAGVDRGDPIAEAAKRFGAGLARAQRDVALRRPAPHQNGNVFGHCSALAQPGVAAGDSQATNRIDNWRKIESSQRLVTAGSETPS